MKKKILIIIACIVISIMLITIAIILVNKDKVTPIPKDNTIKSEELKKTLKVEGLNELEITGIEIKEVEGEPSIEGSLKNTSDKDLENLELNVSLLDKNNSEILSFTIYISKINANATTSFQAASTEDLSTVYSYKVSK